MLSNSILLPPSPNWYGSQLIAAQPSAGLVAYAGHNSVVIADINLSRIIRTMCAAPARVTAIAWAPDTLARYQVVAGHEDGSLRTWDARTGACVRSHKKKGQEATALVLLDKQPALAVVGDVKGGLTTWAFQTASKPQPMQLTLRSRVTQLVALPTSGPISQSSTEASSIAGLQAHSDTMLVSGPQFVAAACVDGTVTLVDVDTGTAAYCFTAHRGPVQAMSGGHWSATPPSLRSMGCVLLVTASGDEGSIKVWQVSLGSRMPSATLLATLGASTGRHDGGRHAKQRAPPNQWMSACALPTSSIHSALLTPAAHTANNDTLVPADNAAAHACWVAIGQGSGEIHIHRINTSSGKVSSPYKLNNVHNRPIYSIVAMPTYATAAAALPVISTLTAQKQDKQIAEPTDTTTAEKVGETEHIADDVTTSFVDQENATPSTPVKTSAAAGNDADTGIFLASISQDRMLTVTRLNFGMKAVSGGKAGKAAGKQSKKQEQQITETQGKEEALTAASEQQPDAAVQKTKQQPHTTAAGTANAVSMDVGSASTAAGAALHPAGPVSGEPVSNIPASTSSEGHQTKAAKALPTFRVALGPPTDLTQKGFIGRGRGIALSPATGQQHTPGQANAAGISAPGAPSSQQEHGHEHERAAVGDDYSTETAKSAVMTQPMRIVTPVIPSSLQPSAGFEVDQQVTGELQWQVTSHHVAWRCPGLGGYAHHIAVQGSFQPTAQQQPPSQTADATDADTGHVTDTVSGCCEWDVVTGCGDRTVRLTHIHWPANCKITKHTNNTVEEATETTGTAGGTDAGNVSDNKSENPTAATVPNSAKTTQNNATAQDAQEHLSSTVVGPPTQKMQISVLPPTIRNVSMLWRGLSDQVICVAPHPASSRFIAFGCQDGQVGIFDMKENHPYLYPTRHQGPVMNLSWYAPMGVEQTGPTMNSQLVASPSNKGKTAATVKINETAEQQGGAGIQDVGDKGMTPPPPPPLPESFDAVGHLIESVDETASKQTTEQDTDVNQSDSTQTSADLHNKRKQAAAAHAAAVHAHCQLWQLVSCGAEGRLLAWQLPSAADLHHVGQTGINPGQTGLPGSGTSRGGADRAGRWGAAAANTPMEYANDLMIQLQPAIKSAVDASTGHHNSVACMSVLPQDVGDLLVIASSSGALFILRGTSSPAQPLPTNLQPPLQQLGGKPRRRSSSGAGAAPGTASATVVMSQLSWQLLWQGTAAGGAPSHIACELSCNEPDTLLVAAASNTGSITCYRAHLAASSPAGTTVGGAQHPAPVDQVNTTDSANSSSSSMFRSIQTNGGVTAMAWLLNGSALAVATTQETPIQIWGFEPLQHASDKLPGDGTDKDSSRQPSSSAGKQSINKPVLLTNLRGHTDHVQCISSKMITIPAGCETESNAHPQHIEHQSESASVPLMKLRQEPRQLVWLFTASKDQSVRCWVLDLPQLWQQYHQHQQQLALAAAQQQQQAFEQQQQQDAQVGDTYTPQTPAEPQADTSIVSQSHDKQLPTQHEGPDNSSLQPASETQTQAMQGVTETPDTNMSTDAQGVMPEPLTCMIAAPAKSELAGIPGGRGKGAKKPPMLADKPLLGEAANASATTQVAAQVQQAAIAALSQLNTLLSDEAAGNGHHLPTGISMNTLGSSTGGDVVATVQQLVSDTADPVALSAFGQIPHSPERLIMLHLWQGDIRKALQLAIEHQLLTADLVSVSASMGRPVWSATSRLYAAQQEAAGQVHVAAMHLIAIGDRASAASVYRRAGLFKEAHAVDGVPSLLQASH